MKAIFFCYDENTSLRDKLIDQAHALSLIGFLVLVFLDWSYWKAAPYPIHTLLVYGLIFTFMFLRFVGQT